MSATADQPLVCPRCESTDATERIHFGHKSERDGVVGELYGCALEQGGCGTQYEVTYEIEAKEVQR